MATLSTACLTDRLTQDYIRRTARDVHARMLELAEGSGCENGAARAHEKGRLAVLVGLLEALHLPPDTIESVP